MKTVTCENTYEFLISKSQFISYLAPATTIEQAKEYIEMIKKRYPSATHHVSAYIIGSGGEYGHFNDDGEPSGTAGLPIFDVLRKNNLSNVVSVVIRFFGGIKLGAGGLVRSYSKSVSENIKTASIVPIITYETINFVVPYSFLKDIELLLEPYEINDRQFSDKVRLEVKIPLGNVVELKQQLTEKTLGQIIFKEKS